MVGKIIINASDELEDNLVAVVLEQVFVRKNKSGIDVYSFKFLTKNSVFEMNATEKMLITLINKETQ